MPDASSLRRPLRALLALLALAACATPREVLPPVVTLPPATNAVIVYGGIGYLDKRAQPALDQLIYGQSDGGPAPFVLDIRRHVVGRPLAPALSVHPVVDDPDAFAALVADKNALDPAAIRGQALADEIAGSRVYVLSLVAGLEFDFQVPSATTMASFVRGGSLVTMSAILARPGSGEIVLASQATTEIEVLPGEPPRIAEAYADAARRAVDNLRLAAAAWQPGATTTMVTGVVLGGTSASRLFEFVPNTGMATNGPCAIELRCPTNPLGESSCRKLQAALANLATEALAAKGRTMLPPRDFAVWADIAEDVGGQAVGLLRLPTTGGWYARDQLMTLRLAPEAADEKVVVVLNELRQETRPSGNVHVAEHRFAADLRLDAYRGRACTTATLAGRLDLFRGNPALTCNYPVSIDRIEGQAAKLYHIGALRKALDLGGDRNSGGRCT
jgi:hypothetical protein